MLGSKIQILNLHGVKSNHPQTLRVNFKGVICNLPLILLETNIYVKYWVYVNNKLDNP